MLFVSYEYSTVLTMQGYKIKEILDQTTLDTALSLQIRFYLQHKQENSYKVLKYLTTTNSGYCIRYTAYILLLM